MVYCVVVLTNIAKVVHVSLHGYYMYVYFIFHSAIQKPWESVLDILFATWFVLAEWNFPSCWYVWMKCTPYKPHSPCQKLCLLGWVITQILDIMYIQGIEPPTHPPFSQTLPTVRMRASGITTMTLEYQRYQRKVLWWVMWYMYMYVCRVWHICLYELCHLLYCVTSPIAFHPPSLYPSCNGPLTFLSLAEFRCLCPLLLLPWQKWCYAQNIPWAVSR